MASLSARRAWIEILITLPEMLNFTVALRKESVDRNSTYVTRLPRCQVVALRKESVDRNYIIKITRITPAASLSARRAWIEIPNPLKFCAIC